MKKLVIIMIFSILLITGCTKKIKFSEEELHNRQAIINLIGVTSEQTIVLKEQNKRKEDLYYVYQIDGRTYTEYLYTFHNSKSSYEDAIKQYSSNTYYNFYAYDNAYVTKITLEKNIKVDNEDIKGTILKKYKDQKYQIIE